MSDVFEGPGWWMASDGRWYPPERHPDPAYRARFLPEPPPDEPEEKALESDPNSSVAEPGQGDGGFPSIAAEVDDSSQKPPGFADLAAAMTSEPVEDARTASSSLEAEPAGVEAEPAGVEAEPAGVDVASVEREAVPSGFESISSTSSAGAPSASVVESNTTARPEVRIEEVEASPPNERPVFDTASSLSTQPVRTAPHGDVQLEVGREHREQVLQIAADAVAKPVRTGSTALVPTRREVYDEVTVRDRLVALSIFVSGVAMIVASFLTWSTVDLSETGWDRGDGMITVIAGVIGSAAAGPIAVGYRHLVPKLVAMVVGALGFAVAALAWVTVVSEESSGSVGVGLIIVGVASLTMAMAGLADRGDSQY